LGGIFGGGEDVAFEVGGVAVAVVEELVGRMGDEIQGPCEGIVDGELLRVAVLEEDVAVAAVLNDPPREGVVVVGEAGEEEVGAADDGCEVWVGAAAEGGEGWDGRAVGVEEEAEERGWAGGAEGAAESWGRADGVEEGTAAEGSTDEAGQGGEAEKDLAEEIVSEIDYGSGSGRRRRRLLRGHGHGCVGKKSI
jgi:hypothetical protein